MEIGSFGLQTLGTRSLGFLSIPVDGAVPSVQWEPCNPEQVLV